MKIMKGTVNAVIEQVYTVLPETQNKLNSKFAIVLFELDNQKYLSKNRIQVPLYCQIGDTIKVKYNLDNPSEVFTNHLFVI